MADEIKKTSADSSDKKKSDKAVKSAKTSAPKKEGNIFSRAWKAIKKFFKDVRGECKKVVWPDAKTVLKSTGVVLLCVAVLGVIIWLIDTGLSAGVHALVNLANKSSGDAEATTEAVTQAAGAIFGFYGF